MGIDPVSDLQAVLKCLCDSSDHQITCELRAFTGFFVCTTHLAPRFQFPEARAMAGRWPKSGGFFLCSLPGWGPIAGCQPRFQRTVPAAVNWPVTDWRSSALAKAAALKSGPLEAACWMPW